MDIIGKLRLYREAKDPREKEMWMEVTLAGLVVIRTIGQDWWLEAKDEVDSWVKGERSPVPRSHPVSKFMTAGSEREVQSESWGQIVRLGSDFLTLLDQPAANASLEAKIPEFRSRGSFFDAWFEVSVAAIFIRKGMQAILIKEEKRERRPDIEVQSQFGKLLVECKARTKLSAEERSSDDVYRRRMKVRLGGVDDLVDDALGKLDKVTCPALVAVSLDLPQSPAATLELKLLRSNLELKFIRNPVLSGVLLFSNRIAKDPATNMTMMSTDIKVLRNQNASHPMPEEFFRVIVDSAIDTRPKMNYITDYALDH
jgi:hypothetical protein